MGNGRSGNAWRALSEMMCRLTLILLAASTTCHAILAPEVNGMSKVWADEFAGRAGDCVDKNSWDIIGSALSVNLEVQTYTDTTWNLQLSGSGSVRLVPVMATDGSWTSSRIESKGSWVAEPGAKLRIQASLRNGAAPGVNKQGIWPAFWTLGDAVRHGTDWPLCGELDIMERVNGAMAAFATAHCQQPEGGICNEPKGKQQTVALPDDDYFHTWSIEWDRTTENWVTETITWRLDDNIFYTLTGADVNNETVWATLAHAPYYMILNVAVGGTWPGPTDALTESGYGNMLEAEYVAVYESSSLADRRSSTTTASLTLTDTADGTATLTNTEREPITTTATTSTTSKAPWYHPTAARTLPSALSTSSLFVPLHPSSSSPSASSSLTAIVTIPLTPSKIHLTTGWANATSATNETPGYTPADSTGSSTFSPPSAADPNTFSDATSFAWPNTAHPSSNIGVFVLASVTVLLTSIFG